MNEKYREPIWCLKGLAIISVIYAHCPNRVSYSAVDAFLDNVRNNIGTVGVPIFLLLSGYLFHNNISARQFWRKKRKLMIQWLFWGTAVWGYEVLRKGLGYANLLKWLAGIGTYLWFMHTIVILWLIFYYARNVRIQITLFVLSLLYHIITYDFGIRTFVNDIGVVNNVLCHMPFFAFGLCLQNERAYGFLERLLRKKYIWFRGGIALICIFFALLINKNKVAYGSPLFLMFIAGSGILCIEICRIIRQNERISSILCWLGKNSYIIYLTHMPIAGIVSNVCSRSRYLLYGVILYPLAAVAVSAAGVFLLDRICKKISGCFGYRHRRTDY